MSTQVIEVLDASGTEPDRLLVRGTLDWVVDENGNQVIVTAGGWLSALTNHYDGPDVKPEDYVVDKEVSQPNRKKTGKSRASVNPNDETGRLNRKQTAQPRPMTKDERMAYYVGLLEEQYPQPAPAPVPLDF